LHALENPTLEAIMKFWGIVGYLTLAAVVVGIVVNMPDIKRYIRISTM
jgi:hypothetical protein